jgi:hypothetical protein
MWAIYFAKYNIVSEHVRDAMRSFYDDRDVAHGEPAAQLVGESAAAWDSAWLSALGFHDELSAADDARYRALVCPE